MQKKAFLVGFAPLTRVIVEVPDDFSEDTLNDYQRADIVRAAREKMTQDIGDYLCGDNCDILEQDHECPYDPHDPNDNPDARVWVIVNGKGDRLFQYGRMVYEDEARRTLRTAQARHPGARLHLETRPANEQDT